MACAFCRSTPVSPCPVCEVKPVTQVLRRTPGKAPALPAVAPKAATPAIATTPAVAALPEPAQAVARQFSDALTGKILSQLPVDHPERKAARMRAMAAGVLQAWGEGEVGLAGHRMTDVVGDRGQADYIAFILGLIDENAKVRGYIVERDAKLRASLIEGMAAEWKRVHGFDPRFEVPPAPKAQASIELDTRPTSPERPALTGPKTETEVPALALGLVVGDWSTLNALVNSGTLTHAEGMAVKARWDAAAKSTGDVLSALLANRKPALA